MTEDDTDQPQTETGSTSEDVFALVGNEIRTEILRVLRAEEGLSFSELRSRLPIDVEPSQLHYHLQQLVGHFVMKSDSDYHLHAAGEYFCQTLRAGTFDRRQDHLPVNPDLDCYHCQASVEAILENGYIRIRCPNCGSRYGSGALKFPFAAFKDEVTAFSHFKRYIALKTLFMARGICPSCAAPIEPEFKSIEENSGHRKVGVSLSCDRCGAPWDLPVGGAVLADPGLIAFCYDHGVDVLSTPIWELGFAATDNHLSICSTDPWEVAIEVTFDGETLELVVDGDLNVLEHNRFDASAMDEIVLPDKPDCMDAIHRHRWSDGVVCPHCDSSDTTKDGTTSKDVQRYMCRECNITFNDLTGTVFADHQLTIPEMFYIIREMDETERTTIAQQLDRSYPSILDFVHQVQEIPDEELDFDLSDIFDAVENP